MTIQTDERPRQKEIQSNCYKHSQTETNLRCKRCEKYVCAKCRIPVEVGILCLQCHGVATNTYQSMDAEGRVNPYHATQDRPFFTIRLTVLIGIIGLIVILEQTVLGSNRILSWGSAWGPGLVNGEWWRLFTPLFLHANINHLVFNMIALASLAPEIEALYGRWRFLVIYLLSGLYGGLFSFAFFGLGEFSVGASGAIFGIVGMTLAFFMFYRRHLREYATKMNRRMLIVIGLATIYGVVVGNVNHIAHLGGLIIGGVSGYLLAPRYWLVDEDAGGPLIDSASLAKRWWVVAVALILFIVGVWFVQWTPR